VNDYILSREDVVTLVENLAGVDGRVAVTPLALTVWVSALQGRAAVDSQAAVTQWFAEDRPGPPSAAAIKRMTISAATSREARDRARRLEPPRPPVEEVPFRERRREEFARLRAAARAAREEDLAAREVTARDMFPGG